MPSSISLSLINSPSIEADTESDSSFSLNRRSSSGGLLSPEVELSGTSSKPLGDAAESDGFYMLKKDSQRRATLSKVLSHDETKICDVWMDKIENNHKVQVVISKHNLEIMIRALRDYIIDQNQEILESAMAELKKSLDFDSTAIDHLHLALYSFQDAVISVLRSHSIKPHWMFALDNLVKSSVQAAITVLSPELGANLAGQDRLENAEEEETMSTSGISTVNSTKQKPKKIEHHKYINEEITGLKVENVQLLQDLLDSQRIYQNLLKSTIDEQNLNLEMLRNFTQQLSGLSLLYDRSVSQGYFSDISESSKNPQDDLTPSSVSPIPPSQNVSEVDASNTKNVPRKMSSHRGYNFQGRGDCNRQPLTNGKRLHIPNDYFMRSATTSIDSKLNDWLIRNNVDNVSRNIIFSEDFTYEDFVYNLDKSDLLRLNLKCGVEVRIWRALQNHRNQFSSLTEELSVISRDDINHNQQQPQPRIVFQSPSPIPIPIQKSGSDTNCNSYDSNRTTSSDDVIGSDYESCNGNFD